MKEIIIPFAVGISLFMFGMQIMKLGLNNLAAHKLKDVLTRFTKTPVHSFITGTIITMLLQSSSAVTVITIGLTNARLLTFSQTIGIILGSNIGTTVTTQIIALDIYEYAVPIFLIGAFFWFLPHHILRCTGLALAGFGCIFLGMDAMQDIVHPIRETGIFRDMVMWGSESSVIGILIGTVITAAIQSSSATTAITMNFMGDHLIPLTMAIAIVLGSNIGTCMTALIASIGGNTASIRVAWSHIILNVAGVIAFIPLIGFLALISTTLTAHPPAQVAHAQTIFNVVCSFVVLPFASLFAKFIEYLIPEKK
ncbi:Na/Pi cotransporter family protein [Ammoniphilus sp. CFH 90114]|uniref:Na/Pi cotransporter family protein n=1 Tax=Ammoniphilus sp. CFH 90114 TaxID=2493665 RepID=UPI00100F1B6C|nr:Na/Pi symporter [Ammoniphilus sp. CFH 90114]RXT14819.1 Na/Pi cotransporter family protein [Ammoniphilus sp. CFH 90114]